MERGLPPSRPLPWSYQRAQEGWHHLARSRNEFSLATGAASLLISNTLRHLFGSWDREKKPALPHPTTHGAWRIPGQVTVCPNLSGPDPAPTHPAGTLCASYLRSTS